MEPNAKGSSVPCNYSMDNWCIDAPYLTVYIQVLVKQIEYSTEFG